MIIFEGADKVGKTTAAQRLCELTGLEYRHMSRPVKDFDHMSGYMSMVGEHVQDRFHLGSIVYGRILGGGNYPSAREMRVVQSYLRWQGCLVVVLHMQRWRLEELLNKPGAMTREMYSREQIIEANYAYRALAESSNRGDKFADLSFDVTDDWLTDNLLREIHHQWSSRWTK